MDSALNSSLARKAGVDSTTARQASGAADVATGLAKAVTSAISQMSYEDERILGETVGVQLYATRDFGEPINNKELMLYMNTLVNVLAQNSSRPDIPYYVAVIDTDRKNAYAVPGGFIFITSGLILTLQNEAQLAVVLGHEIAHIAKRHTLNEMKNSKTLGGLVEAGGGALKASSFGSPSQFASFSGFIKDLSNNIFTHSLPKETELEADAEGIRYAYDTGYDPKAMLGVFDIISEKDSQVNGDHVTTAERREAFNQLMQEEKFQGDASGVMETGRLQQAKQWIQSGNAGW
ncbi:M48 family metalloprotease [Candidatus Uabimicrobium amorphum]|nr:M48 family metalloprotease [Candidatus Uabimicrobium amorphum]